MSRIWFTSDLHLGHNRAAELRGYPDTLSHNNAVIASLKQYVGHWDLLWVLGDIAWNPVALAHLNAVDGQKRAVLGNHDTMDTQTYLRHFIRVDGAVKKYGLWLTHIPIHPQEVYRAVAHVHGHIHKGAATSNLGFPYINVNWDFWRRPLSLAEIREITKNNGTDYSGELSSLSPRL